MNAALPPGALLSRLGRREMMRHGSLPTKIIHPQAHDNYRVILKLEEGEFEIGSIGVQHSAGALYFWAWSIDTVIPMRALETQGRGRDRRDCMNQFKAAWERFAADEANLTEFLDMKRKRCC